jgi:hypothetical protein
VSGAAIPDEVSNASWLKKVKEMMITRAKTSQRISPRKRTPELLLASLGSDPESCAGVSWLSIQPLDMPGLILRGG